MSSSPKTRVASRAPRCDHPTRTRGPGSPRPRRVVEVAALRSSDGKDVDEGLRRSRRGAHEAVKKAPNRRVADQDQDHVPAVLRRFALLRLHTGQGSATSSDAACLPAPAPGLWSPRPALLSLRLGPIRLLRSGRYAAPPSHVRHRVYQPRPRLRLRSARQRRRFATDPERPAHLVGHGATLDTDN